MTVPIVCWKYCFNFWDLSLLRLPTQERDPNCHAVLDEALTWSSEVAGHDPRGCCMFSEIMDLIPHGTLHERTETYTQKLSAVESGGVATFGHCLKHPHPCPVHKRSDFDCSGLPCPDMSSAGCRRKRAGQTSEVYMSHGKYTGYNRTPLLLMECTKYLWQPII